MTPRQPGSQRLATAVRRFGLGDRLHDLGFSTAFEEPSELGRGETCDYSGPMYFAPATSACPAS
jgi:hypothetical protein